MVRSKSEAEGLNDSDPFDDLNLKGSNGASHLARQRVPNKRPRVLTTPEKVVESAPVVSPELTKTVEFWTGPKVALAVFLMLALHMALAVNSLLQENPTVDEVAHLPAGVSYWEKGTFKLYHHN